MRDGGDSLLTLEDVAGDLSTETGSEEMKDTANVHGISFDR